ncbi:MAG: hypothetical protein R2733_00205 [Acidimicrobiales bacterium]
MTMGAQANESHFSVLAGHYDVSIVKSGVETIHDAIDCSSGTCQAGAPIATAALHQVGPGGIGCQGGNTAESIVGQVSVHVANGQMVVDIVYSGAPNLTLTVELFEATESFNCVPDNLGVVAGVLLTTDATGNGSVLFSVPYPYVGYNGTIGDGTGSDDLVVVLDGSLGQLE